MTLHRASPSRGFSLIEILVAVVILATGLLALTALQGSLAKASAEAKVRGRVAAFMAGRMETLRNGPYAAIVAGSDSCASTTAPDWVPASVCTDAALGAFSASQTVTTWAGNASFVEGATPADPDDAQFKRVTLTARWTDSAGRGHSLRSVSDISPLGFTTNLIPPPEAEDSGGGNPKVRQDNPVTAGMIPVALGDGSSSAASNPKPELKQDGRNQRIVATRFNVLNYIPEGDGSTVIQKRFENELVRCKCSMGAGVSDTASIFYQAKWPSVWTGDHYEVYTPDPATTPAPGQSKNSGPTSGVVQSDLCTQCCRDHHDGNSGVKFDPERTINSATSESSGTEKYSRDSATGAYAISTSDYIQACRVIRVDGFWRVAADTYARHFGLLETKPVATVHAKTGSITDGAVGDPSNAKDGYGNFVKAFASGYQTITEASSGDSPGNADSLFNTASPSLNADPIQVLVANLNGDWRYLHARGLYIDHLEAAARKRIQNVLSDTTACPAATKAARPYDCILPYLPFTTINLTEIAKWFAENDHVLQVNSGNIMSCASSLDPNCANQPFGGRTKGIAPTTSTDNDEVVATTLLSNSGLAVYATVNDTDGDGIPDVVTREQYGTDPQDDAQVKEDRQIFDVRGVTNAGLRFYIRSTTSTSTTATYALLGDTDACSNLATDPDGASGPVSLSDIVCVTRAVIGPLGGTFRLGNYWTETQDNSNNNTTVPNTCSLVGGTGYSGGTERILKPVFNNYAITSVSTVTGGGGGTATPVSPSNSDATIAESTDVTFSGATSIATQPTIFNVRFGTPTQISATVDTCTATKNAHGSGWTVTVNTWNKSWCPNTTGNPLNGCR